jgi:UDP-N-acetylmuramate--alanine ligase
MDNDVTLDVSTPTSLHIVGVGGAGMSALAIVLAQMGHQVSGSDLRDSPILDQLRAAGVAVEIGHRPENIGRATWVTGSPAVGADNVEMVAAQREGRYVRTRAQVLGAVTRRVKTFAVTGTHGKTTTSSMLALILVHAQMKPSFIIGAEMMGLGVNAQFIEGSPLVLEADESYGSFSALTPWMTGVTNIEADHLDHYGSLENLEAAFEDLCRRTTGPVVVNADDPGARRLGEHRSAVMVGQGSKVDVALTGIVGGRSTSSFVLTMPDGEQVAITIGAPGNHNVHNAALAATMASLAGVAHEVIAEGLSRFVGVPRRFEFRGEADGVTFVDDYAHLPSEVSAAIDAAVSGSFGRIVAVFQPHRYTRTQAVAHEFIQAFDHADVVIIAPLYSAGEMPIPGVSEKLVADVVRSAGHPDLHLVERVEDLATTVNALLVEGDVCLTMGAGDLTTLPDELIRMRS